jgi:hypothetical protein
MNKSLESEDVPSIWRKANVTAIHKKKEKKVTQETTVQYA